MVCIVPILWPQRILSSFMPTKYTKRLVLRRTHGIQSKFIACPNFTIYCKNHMCACVWSCLLATGAEFTFCFVGQSNWPQNGGFELSSYSEVVDAAVHLYHNRPEATSTDVNSIPFQLYPCMSFTCSERIRSLIFIAPVLNQHTLWPEFGLWRECDRDVEGCEYPYWIEVKRLGAANLQPTLLHVNGANGIYEITFSSNNSFESGDVLGVYNPRPINGSQPITVQYQRGGGYCDAMDLITADNQTENTYNLASVGPILPYIAIETG